MDGNIEIQRYWDLNFHSPLEMKQQEIENRLIDKLREAVQLRLVSDVPLGAFLSGGLDSSTIVNYAKKFNKDINTYSIGFDGKLDETPRINILKDYFKTNHHHKYFREMDFKEGCKKIAGNGTNGSRKS